MGAKWTRWYFPDEISSFQSRFIRAMLIWSPIFTKIAAFNLLAVFACSFPQCPSIFIYYLYGQLGVLVDEENKPTVFRPPVRHPLPIQFWCAIIVLGRGLTSISVSFPCTNLQNEIFLYKPTLWSVLNPLVLVPKSESQLFFYKVKVKGASKYANLRLQNYVNSGRCWLHTSKRTFSVPVYYTQ